MFNPFVRKYESGFTRLVQSPEGVLDTSADPEVVDLYNRMTNSPMGSTNWPFVRTVLLCARRLFNDDLREWLREQDSNGQLTTAAREFLNETVTYINTGVRPVSIGARLRVLVREREQTQTTASMVAIAPIVDMTANPLAQWLRQPAGIVDLVFTLHILFGRAMVRQ